MPTLGYVLTAVVVQRVVHIGVATPSPRSANRDGLTGVQVRLDRSEVSGTIGEALPLRSAESKPQENPSCRADAAPAKIGSPDCSPDRAGCVHEASGEQGLKQVVEELNQSVLAA